MFVVLVALSVMEPAATQPPAPPAPQPAPVTAACWNAVHRFKAAPADRHGVYHDTGVDGGWSGTAVGFDPSEPVPYGDYFNTVPTLTGDNDLRTGQDLFNTTWQAFEFAGDQGILFNTDSSPYVGDATNGLSIAVWFTPRGHLFRQQAIGLNTILTLAKLAPTGQARGPQSVQSPTFNTTLRLNYDNSGIVDYGYDHPLAKTMVMECCNDYIEVVNSYAYSKAYLEQARVAACYCTDSIIVCVRS